MKKSLLALAGVAAIIVIAVAAIPLLVPPEKVKEQIAAQVKAATGRELVIAGAVDVSVLPSLSVKVTDVALSSPPGFAAKELVRLGALDLSLKLLPLFSGQIEVDNFVLIDPVFTLESDAKGRNNWSFETAGGGAESAPATGASFVKDIRLGDVGIRNGRLTYTDGKSGAAETLESINLRIGLTSLDAPLAVDGDMTWRKKPVGLVLEITNPRVVIAGSGETPLTVSLKAEPLTATFTGKLTGADMALDGSVDLASPSVRDLAAWSTGQPLDLPGTGLGPLSIKGHLAAKASKVTFTDAAIALDAIKSKGMFEVETGGARPMLRGKLDVEMLDLNPYLPPPAPAAPLEWSNDPIDASALRSADADFSLSAGGMKMRNITVGRSAVGLRLRGGRLATELKELAFYGGTGNGSVTIDGSQAGVGVEAAFSLKGVAAEPLLTDAADFKRLAGTAHTDAQVSGRGRTQREIVSSLAGKGSVTFANGAIKGLDVAGMVRNITSAFTGQSEKQQTDFAEMSGTYTIANGIVSNKDLSLLAPVLRVSGAGTVDLPNRTVKYRVEPKLAGTLEGQGGKLDVGGLMVPVIVEGPWDKLSYKPDLAAAAKGAAKSVLRGVIGGGDSPKPQLPSLKGLLPGFGKPK